MLIITAFQRSGTTALGEQVGAMPDLAYWGEIFHPDGYTAAESSAKLRLRPGANWFRFVEDVLPPAHRSGPQDEAAVREAWRRYNVHLDRLGSGRRPVLDVKYNSWHHLQPVWAPIAGPPFLATLLHEQGGAYVHLVRGNVLAQALSEVFAHESGLWHRRFGQSLELDAFAFAADTQGLLARMRESRSETALMRTWLEGRPHVELTYEDAFDARGDLSESTRAALASLGVDTAAAPRAPVLGRTGQSPNQWLTNIDEVRAALEGTEFEDLLEPTLGPA
ncbi:MAG: Stf0 sulfotransferase family protein [Pseudomonadota bacterium]|nr:Stf0 sulfotransferase family protein [Pseudomonadota bacterium]